MDAPLAAQTLLADLGATPADRAVLPADRQVNAFLAAMARVSLHPDYRRLVAERVAGRLDRAAFSKAVDELAARLLRGSAAS